MSDTCFVSGCPNKVVEGTRDIREVEPVLINGELWADYRKASGWRTFCRDHRIRHRYFRRGQWNIVEYWYPWNGGKRYG